MLFLKINDNVALFMIIIYGINICFYFEILFETYGKYSFEYLIKFKG